MRTLDPLQEDLETNAWRWDQVLGASRGAAGERRLELHLGDGLCQSARSTLTFDAASDADCTKLLRLLHQAAERAALPASPTRAVSPPPTEAFSSIGALPLPAPIA